MTPEAQPITVGDVPGVRVGHWHDLAAATGCTVIVPPPGTIGAVEVRGGGASTRELELMRPRSPIAGPTALLLTGGSALGLAAADGVSRWCAENGLGHGAGGGMTLVPIVPAAVILDLFMGSGDAHPGPEEGWRAAEVAVEGPHSRGSVGAGAGATVGKILGHEHWCKGGLGAGGVRMSDGVTVAALAVVNAFGDVIDERGGVLAGAFEPGTGFAGAAHRLIVDPPPDPRFEVPESTTLVCVVTDGALDAAGAEWVARMSHSGAARAISPVATPYDGDVTFCLATGGRPGNAFRVGVAAAEATARAIRDAVRTATSLAGVPSAAERRA
jgi:L-aminopeptidase/D-esterase-like protein